MAQVKAISLGYYDHARVKPGSVFEMKEVDKDGFYIDKDGKKVLGKDGKPKKCGWVDNVKSNVAIAADPKEVAKALSGKFPGQKKEAAAAAQ